MLKSNTLPSSSTRDDGLTAAVEFHAELTEAFECFSDIATTFGLRTLTDLLYLQGAMLTGGFIDLWSAESRVMDVVRALPSAPRWARYVRNATSAVHLLVQPASDQALSQEDRDVCGTYYIEFRPDRKPTNLANAALDDFHSTVPVENLDALSFWVVDPVSSLVLKPDADIEGYALTGYTSAVEQISTSWTGVYAVAVRPTTESDVAGALDFHVAAADALSADRAARFVLAQRGDGTEGFELSLVWRLP